MDRDAAFGPQLCAAVTRSLAPQIVAQGIADEAELGLDTLQARIAEEVGARDAVVLPPTVVGAWGHAPRFPTVNVIGVHDRRAHPPSTAPRDARALMPRARG